MSRMYVPQERLFNEKRSSVTFIHLLLHQCPFTCDMTRSVAAEFHERQNLPATTIFSSLPFSERSLATKTLLFAILSC